MALGGTIKGHIDTAVTKAAPTLNDDSAPALINELAAYCNTAFNAKKVWFSLGVSNDFDITPGKVSWALQAWGTGTRQTDDNVKQLMVTFDFVFDNTESGASFGYPVNVTRNYAGGAPAAFNNATDFKTEIETIVQANGFIDLLGVMFCAQLSVVQTMSTPTG